MKHVLFLTLFVMAATLTSCLKNPTDDIVEPEPEPEPVPEPACRGPVADIVQPLAGQCGIGLSRHFVFGSSAGNISGMPTSLAVWENMGEIADSDDDGYMEFPIPDDMESGVYHFLYSGYRTDNVNIYHSSFQSPNILARMTPESLAYIHCDGWDADNETCRDTTTGEAADCGELAVLYCVIAADVTNDDQGCSVAPGGNMGNFPLAHDGQCYEPLASHLQTSEACTAAGCSCRLSVSSDYIGRAGAVSLISQITNNLQTCSDQNDGEWINFDFQATELQALMDGRSDFSVWFRGWNRCWDVDEDEDGDGFVESADNCPSVSNPNQHDEDRDGVGDACDTGNDSDGDGVDDDNDNCPHHANADQLNTTYSHWGDLCNPHLNDLTWDAPIEKVWSGLTMIDYITVAQRSYVTCDWYDWQNATTNDPPFDYCHNSLQVEFYNNEAGQLACRFSPDGFMQAYPGSPFTDWILSE